VFFWTANRCPARDLRTTLAQREAEEDAMRKAKWRPARQRHLLFAVAGQEVRLSEEAGRRGKGLLIYLLRIVLQAERSPRRDND
jgi:hypothetical protein